MKILLTGGGTGGHLIPLLSVVSEIRKRDGSAEFLFVGPKSDFNETLKSAAIEFREVKAGKIRRYFSWENFTDIFKVLIGTDEAFFHILKFKPDVVFSKGGFASFPAVLAASYLRIPILTHESDTVPGFANRLIGKFASKIFISFPGTRNYFPDSKIIVSGNPIREDILQGDKARARKLFAFKEDLPVLMVFGGSQGAQKINEILEESLDEILQKFQVLHVCGMKNFEEIKAKIGSLPIRNKNRYRAYPYLHDEMKDAFAISDFIISRAGASSLSEIIALRKPSLIIPLPSAANNHQYYNAKHFADENLVLMAEEKDLDKNKFLEKIRELQDRRHEITDNLKRYNDSMGSKKPAEIIAEEILKFKK
jgi:UDP-N-acetylglucosamine--N-acetylmuramyl-(pentapeptide) pyrophosphoryl-undecaprenol N-acetylglucosamine transferase